MSAITDETTAAWKAELAEILSETTDPESREALSALTSALAPYFERPEHFATILGKIQMVLLDTKAQGDLMTSNFGSVEEIAARLPEGVSVTVV
jgi:hypothetical protein